MNRRDRDIIVLSLKEIYGILDLEAKGYMSPKGMREEAKAIKEMLMTLQTTLDETNMDI